MQCLTLCCLHYMRGLTGIVLEMYCNHIETYCNSFLLESLHTETSTRNTEFSRLKTILHQMQKFKVETQAKMQTRQQEDSKA